MRSATGERRRKPLRLKGYDYTQAGYYFVTFVTKERALFFDDEAYKKIAEETWLWLAENFDGVGVEDYVVMPNHFHGILVLSVTGRGGSRTAPTTAGAPKTVGQLVGAFKTVSTKRINELRRTPGAVIWQRNYYERVIRNERELQAIRQYIADNPIKWALDPENPRQQAPCPPSF